jgi:hypothetical protein
MTLGPVSDLFRGGRVNSFLFSGFCFYSASSLGLRASRLNFSFHLGLLLARDSNAHRGLFGVLDYGPVLHGIKTIARLNDSKLILLV